MTLSRTMDTHVKSCGQRKVGSACLKCVTVCTCTCTLYVSVLTFFIHV